MNKLFKSLAVLVLFMSCSMYPQQPIPTRVSLEHMPTDVIKEILNKILTPDKHLATIQVISRLKCLNKACNRIIKKNIIFKYFNLLTCAANIFKDYYGFPLHKAIEFGFTDIARYLMENNADIEALDSWERTPLHYAALKGNTDIVKLLLQKGATIKTESFEGKTPIGFAEGKKHKPVVHLLKRATKKKF